MARDAYALLEHETVIFWSRKAGNTSLAMWLSDVVLTERRRRLIGDVHPRKIFIAGQYRVDGRFAERLVKRMDFADFMIVRNPYSRVVSAYINKFVYDGDVVIDSFRMLESFSKRAVIDIYKAKSPDLTPQDIAEAYTGITFLEFLRYIDARVEARGDAEPVLNGHWNTQTPFYFDKGFEYSNIIRLERLAEDLAPLAERLGASATFPRLRTGEAAIVRDRTQESLSSVRSVELAKRNIELRAANLLDPKTKRLIARAFEIDFRKLGYDPAVSIA